MKEDAELLRSYAEEGSEEAFAELVRRHLGLVYHAALRQLGGDEHRAQDVAQGVFTDLARKASSLKQHSALSGWLYTSTHYAAAKLLREAQRRQAREQEAQLMNEIMKDNPASADWDAIRPVLDQVLLQLGERDRQAILLRYFEGRPFADLGRTLGLSEDAARMRVDRALDRMRGLLSRHGISSTGAALATALGAHAASSVPAGFATSVTSLALAQAGSVGTAGFLGFMSITKLQIGLASVLAVAGGAGVVLQEQSNQRLEAELAALRAQTVDVSRVEAEHKRLVQRESEIRQLREQNAELPKLREQIAARKARAAQVALRQAGLKSEGSGSSVGTNALALKQLDVTPKAVRQTPPIYPLSLRLDGEKGESLVSFTIDQNGEVLDVESMRGTDPEFEDAAMRAVKLWKFSPGQKDGKSVATRVQIPIVFALQERPAQPGP